MERFQIPVRRHVPNCQLQGPSTNPKESPFASSSKLHRKVLQPYPLKAMECCPATRTPIPQGYQGCPSAEVLKEVKFLLE